MFYRRLDAFVLHNEFNVTCFHDLSFVCQSRLSFLYFRAALSYTHKTAYLSICLVSTIIEKRCIPGKLNYNCTNDKVTTVLWLRFWRKFTRVFFFTQDTDKRLTGSIDYLNHDYNLHRWRNVIFTHSSIFSVDVYSSLKNN